MLFCHAIWTYATGAKKAAGMKTAETITALSLASQMGKLPIVVDNSPCLAQLKSAGLNQQELRSALSFIHANYLSSTHVCRPHSTCSCMCGMWCTAVAGILYMPLLCCIVEPWAEIATCCNTDGLTCSVLLYAFDVHMSLPLSICRFSLYEPVAFTSLFLTPALDFQRVKGSVALHVPCTSKQVPGLSEKFVELAQKCAETVTPTGKLGLVSNQCRQAGKVCDGWHSCTASHT